MIVVASISIYPGLVRQSPTAYTTEPDHQLPLANHFVNGILGMVILSTEP